MPEELIADMGKYVVSKKPDVLACLALGSCVGVAIYDLEAGMGGMEHVMLPSIEGMVINEGTNVNKFADKAIPNMVNELISKGCNKGRLKAKIAGGAHMFKNLKGNMDDIGKRNAASVKKVLSEMGIPLIGEQLGGGVGRTVRLFLDTGVYQIKTKDGISEI